MIKWLNGTAPMLERPYPGARKVLDVPERSLVETMREADSLVDAFVYERVSYRTDRATFTGWMYSGWLEDYIETLPKDCIEIPDQTPDPRDAEQYFLWNKFRVVNICGEACASYLLNVPLKELLAVWKDHKPAIWRSVVSGNYFRGTSDTEVISIFEAYGLAAVRLTDVLRDLLQLRSRYTVTGLKDLVDSGDVIASVKINGAGRLKPSGSLHWVVILDVEPERTGYGSIRIYNPYPNREERYSWDEFIDSARTPYGVYVPT